MLSGRPLGSRAQKPGLRELPWALLTEMQVFVRHLQAQIAWTPPQERLGSPTEAVVYRTKLAQQQQAWRLVRWLQDLELSSVPSQPAQTLRQRFQPQPGRLHELRLSGRACTQREPVHWQE